MVNLAKNVLQPKWLQQHPSTYLDKLLSKSQEKIKSLLQGGVSAMEPNHLAQPDEDLPDKGTYQDTPYTEELMIHCSYKD